MVSQNKHDDILSSLALRYHVHQEDELTNRTECTKVRRRTYFQFGFGKDGHFGFEFRKQNVNTESFLAYINEYWQSVFNLNHIEDTANEPVFLSIEGLRFTGQKSIYDKHDEVVYWIKFFQTISSSLRKEAGVLVEQVSESIHERLRSFKKWANRALLTILAFLGKKRKSKKGIGKDIEGFIPFATWPRPPSNSQLVNSFIFLDKLSHPNNYMEISHGC